VSAARPGLRSRWELPSAPGAASPAEAADRLPGTCGRSAVGPRSGAVSTGGPEEGAAWRLASLRPLRRESCRHATPPRPQHAGPQRCRGGEGWRAELGPGAREAAAGLWEGEGKRNALVCCQWLRGVRHLCFASPEPVAVTGATVI